MRELIPLKRDKKLIRSYTLVSALILMGCLISLPGCLAKQTPAILFDGEQYKFGEVTAGEDVVFTFYFKNSGAGDLKITDLFVSCDCVEIKEYDRIVKPDEKGKVYGVIKTKSLQGEITRAIRVETNVPQSQPVILSLEGKVLVPFVSQPKQ